MLNPRAPTEDRTKTIWVAEMQSDSASIPLAQNTRPPRTNTNPPARLRAQSRKPFHISMMKFKLVYRALEGRSTQGIGEYFVTDRRPA